MCGLTGYITLKKSISSTNTINEMLLMQKHRGPDDHGVVLIDDTNRMIKEYRSSISEVSGSPSIAFGFNRLSILDLSVNGHQPMINSSEDVVLMMNGEVYNAFDFKDELIAKGYTFKSTTDTEVVLNLYLEYGIKETIERLNGMFAIVIYDKRQRKVFLVRDRFGIKPLYLLRNENYIAFSSEMKSFKCLPDFKFELDKTNLDEFLLFRNCVNNTLFKDIINIEQGVIYDYDLEKQEFSEVRYFDINAINTIESSTLVNHEIEDALKKAIKYQMISDVKLGSQLSGGIDSSLVTHFANKELKDGNLESISIVFQNKNFSEEKYIDFVAQNEKIKVHKFPLEEAYYIDTLMRATWHFEQPLNHPNTIGIYLLSEKAKKHVTVLLSGEGADETFAGYGSYLNLKKKSIFSKDFLKKLKSNINNLNNFLSYYFSESGKILMSAAFGNIALSKKVYKNFNFERAINQRKNIVNKIKGSSINRQRKFDFLTYLPDLLMRQDKMSMAHSIENRVPFLDNDLVQKAFLLPENELLKIHNGKLEGKYILKNISKGIFGEQFTFRNKQGFGIPLKEFFSSDKFISLWEDKLFPSIKERDLFDAELLNGWLKNINNVPYKNLEMFWIAISFEIWASLYLDDKKLI